MLLVCFAAIYKLVYTCMTQFEWWMSVIRYWCIFILLALDVGPVVWRSIQQLKLVKGVAHKSLSSALNLYMAYILSDELLLWVIWRRYYRIQHMNYQKNPIAF